MNLQDKVECVGHFKIESYNADGTVDVFEEKNLIMDVARNNMARLLGGVTTGAFEAKPIDKIVLGTQGHANSNILTPKQVGSDGFESTKTELFSEVGTTDYNYKITFVPDGDENITVNGTGIMYQGTVQGATDATANTIQRVVSDRTVTYTITVPAENANHPLGGTNVLPYTEAALYADTSIFSMKCFSGRIKEETVKFVITWSIIF